MSFCKMEIIETIKEKGLTITKYKFVDNYLVTLVCNSNINNITSNSRPSLCKYSYDKLCKLGDGEWVNVKVNGDINKLIVSSNATEAKSIFDLII